MDNEKLKQLQSNVNKLIALHKEREETVKELIRLTLRFLPGSKEYVNLGYAQHQQKRKQLIEALETYVNGDHHAKN